MDKLNNVVRIGSGLALLGTKGYKTLSITDEAIFVGDDNVSINDAEILEYYNWYYDSSVNSWKFDLAQLEE